MKRKIFIALIISCLFASSAFAFASQTKWKYSLDSIITSNITVSENILLFGTITGRFYALDKNTGSLIWEYKGINSILGTSVVLNNNVYFAQSDGTITCLKVSDGSVVWQVEATGTIDELLNDGLSAGEGLLFVAKADNKIHALDASNGQTVWTYAGSAQGLRTEPIYFDGIVFVGEYDGIFSMLDAKTGERLNGGGAGGALNTPAVNNGNVYYSSWDGSINAVKIKDVIPLWRVNVKDGITTAPAINSGIIAIGTARGKIFALNEENGSIIWEFDTKNGSVAAKPVIADGFVFAGSGDGKMYALNAETGKAQFTFDAGIGINTDPVYSEGVLYFGSGVFYALQ